VSKLPDVRFQFFLKPGFKFAEIVINSSTVRSRPAAAQTTSEGASVGAGEPNKRLTNYSWIVLAYTTLVIGWGAIVRATFSGDGCGNHWPLCDGQLMPSLASQEMIYEFSHRMSTAVLGPMILALVVWVFKAFPKGHFARKGAVLAGVMTLAEAIIGMALVKLELVDTNDSIFRAWMMGFHVNTAFLLVGALAAVLVAAKGAADIRVKGQGAVGWVVGIGFLGMMVLGFSGGVSALGHTLYPANDVLKAAADPGSHWMVRLQPMHPYLAITVGLYLILVSGLLQHLRPSKAVVNGVRLMLGIFGLEMVIGLVNIWLKAPEVMQALHLMVADILFGGLVALAIAAFAVTTQRKDTTETSEEAAKLDRRGLVNAYISLTKPRIISLLLFTTLTASFAAAGGWPGFTIFFGLFIGGYMVAGAANAINMVIDRDIDGVMKRTATRPTVSQAISSTDALLFALTLAAGAFAILTATANLLTAMLGLAGLVFYVIVYTLLLKRRTWHNIVIGGAAGAFPPLVGWAAVTNDVAPLAVWLFAIVFLWTPVHFWALALLIKDEYQNAAVPMLPVVKGDKATVVQIVFYMILTVLATLAPAYYGFTGLTYLVACGILNAGLVVFTIALAKQINKLRAMVLFKYSMLYLALLFLMLAIDRSVAV
jgi:protoheme IX farnesyltransferase